MLNAADKVRSVFEAIVRFFAHVCIGLVTVLVLLVSLNVVLRYVFGTGVIALQELEWHALVPVAVIGIAYALQEDYHVRVDVLLSRLPRAFQAGMEIVSLLLLIAVAAYLVWITSPYAHSAYIIGESSAVSHGLPYRWALKAVVPFGFILLTLQGVASLLNVLVRWARDEPLKAERNTM